MGMRVNWVKGCLLAFMLLAAVTPGRAAQFDYTGLDGRVVHFSLPDSPGPADPGWFADAGNGFALFVTLLDSAAGPVPVVRNINFYLASQSGGFYFFFDTELSVAGAQLFSGTEFNPTFVAGTYDLNFFDISLLEVTGPAGTLVISGIPEPLSLVAFSLGLFGLAAARRARR